MEVRVQLAQLEPSLSSLPQMGLNRSQALDRICQRVNMAGDFFGSCITFSPPSWATCSPVAIKPFLVLKSSLRKQSDDGSRRGRISTTEDISLMRYRMRRGHDGQGDRNASGSLKVWSFVDEVTTHSAIHERDDGEAGGPDLESGGMFRESDDQLMADREPLAEVDERDQESFEEDGEYGSGITSEGESMPSDNVDYSYEDMQLGEKKKNWSIADMSKIDLLRSFDYRQGNEKGVFVVQAMRVEHMKRTEELLVDSFAELMGGLLTYRPLLALTVQQYMRDRYACLPDAVTLVGLYAPAEDKIAMMGSAENEYPGNWLLAGTVELSFSNTGHPDIPAGPAPPPGSPYLCNMAVSSTYRRRGLGQQLLKAAEELAISMGAQDLYLHCRLGDLAPLNMYQGAGYQIVATDSILSLLSFQRRRYLMHKRLQEPLPISTIH